MTGLRRVATKVAMYKALAQGRSTTPDGTAAFERSTVSIERRARPSGAEICLRSTSAEFRQLSEQSAAGDRADSRSKSTAHAWFSVFPDRVFADELGRGPYWCDRVHVRECVMWALILFC